jgi:hypothetical protein
MKSEGLPHSGISGSKPAYGSPKLFVVSHALLRLSVPRHPPHTLSTLINKFNKHYPTNLIQQQRQKSQRTKYIGNVNQITYPQVLENTGIEPVAFGVQNRRSSN